MALGGFSTLTKEQAAKCMLLEVIVVPLEAEGLWVLAKPGPPLKLMCDQDGTMMKFKSVDEAIETYAENPKGYRWE